MLYAKHQTRAPNNAYTCAALSTFWGRFSIILAPINISR
jgi:hypothetical protein